MKSYYFIQESKFIFNFIVILSQDYPLFIISFGVLIVAMLFIIILQQ